MCVCVSATPDHCVQLCCVENLAYLIQYEQGLEHVKLFLTRVTASCGFKSKAS